MTEKQKEQRAEALLQSSGFCLVCGKPLIKMQGAHRIGNRETYRRKYGSWVIDNPKNIVIVDTLECNAKCDVGGSYGAHLDVIADILIAEYVKMWGNEGLTKLTDKLLAEYSKRGIR